MPHGAFPKLFVTDLDGTALGGAVGQDVASRGVIQAFMTLAQQQGWEF